MANYGPPNQGQYGPPLQFGGSPAPYGTPPPYGNTSAPYGTPPQGPRGPPPQGSAPPSQASLGPLPPAPPGFGGAPCPPGMELMINTTALIVKQQVEMMEVLTGWETNNRYDILSMNGARIFLAAEQTGGFDRQFHGAGRGFTILVFDMFGRVVLKLQRNPNHGCTDSMVWVYDAGGMHLGDVLQLSCQDPQFIVKDGGGNDRLRIVGPKGCCFGPQSYFTVFDLAGNNIGGIHKQWSGFAQEHYTNADTFGVQFPLELEPHMKCVLLGGVFLIDFLFFEQRSGGQRERPFDHHHHHHSHHHRY